jgi:hypothetical protein
MIKLLTITATLGLALAIYLYGGVDGTKTAPKPQPVPVSAAAKAADQDGDSTEVVLGLRVRKDRNCTVELRDYVTTEGEMFSAWSCTPDEEPAPHPYAHYDDATLELMAWADAEAAALLGRRLLGHDSDKSYELLIRAAALDGNIQHLHWLADQAFSAVQINDEIQVPNIKRRYELAALASHFGDDPENALAYRNVLLDAGVDARQMDELDAHVDEQLRTVRAIQLAVFGEVRYGGLNDA